MKKQPQTANCQFSVTYQLNSLLRLYAFYMSVVSVSMLSLDYSFNTRSPIIHSDVNIYYREFTLYGCNDSSCVYRIIVNCTYWCHSNIVVTTLEATWMPLYKYDTTHLHSSTLFFLWNGEKEIKRNAWIIKKVNGSAWKAMY